MFSFVSIHVNSNNLREARDELRKAARKRERSEEKKQDAEGNLKRSKSAVVPTESSIETSSIKKEKDFGVEEDVWQRDKIGDVQDVDEVVSEEVEGVDNDDLDRALAEADLGFTLDS